MSWPRQNSEPTRVHPDDDFLALGGQSLSGTRLSGRLSSALGTPVSLRTILEHRTPRAIAEAVAAGDTDTGFTPEEFAEHYTQHTPTRVSLRRPHLRSAGSGRWRR